MLLSGLYNSIGSHNQPGDETMRWNHFGRRAVHGLYTDCWTRAA